MEVAVLEDGDTVDFPDGLPNNLLSIAFGTQEGCSFITGLEMNLAMTFTQSREVLKQAGKRKAVRRMDRYMNRYRKNRFVWN